MPELQTVLRRVKRAGEEAQLIEEQVITGTEAEAEAVQAENDLEMSERDQALADYLLSRPDFRTNLAAALTRLNTGAGHIQTEAANIATQATTAPITTLVAALQNLSITNVAGAQAALRNVGTVLESMRTAHNLEALAIRDEAVFLRRTIQVVATSLGIPLQ